MSVCSEDFSQTADVQLTSLFVDKDLVGFHTIGHSLFCLSWHVDGSFRKQQMGSNKKI